MMLERRRRDDWVPEVERVMLRASPQPQPQPQPQTTVAAELCDSRLRFIFVEPECLRGLPPLEVDMESMMDDGPAPEGGASPSGWSSSCRSFVVRLGRLSHLQTESMYVDSPSEDEVRLWRCPAVLGWY